MLDPSSVFTGLAQALLASEELSRNVDFVMVYTHALNIILLTAPETQFLRSAVSSDRLAVYLNHTHSNFTYSICYRNLFTALFKSWCLNPAAVLSLCLVAEAYSLSSQIIIKLTERDVSIGLLMQLDKVTMAQYIYINVMIFAACTPYRVACIFEASFAASRSFIEASPGTITSPVRHAHDTPSE